MGYNHILLVDDNESIHEDIESILSNSVSKEDEELKGIEDELFGSSPNEQEKTDNLVDYEIDHAYQGKEAVEMVSEAYELGDPYALIFMDVRMPPGIDGIQTIKQIWEDYPYTEIVICTAYSDYSWDKIVSNLGNTDKLLFMKKPFDATALKQIALTLTTKWKLQQEAISYTEKLEEEVDERTSELNELVEKYKEMKDKAEKASAAKSVFLANMSHEIRTPMNGVIGMTDLLLETDLSEEQKELSRMAKRSGESLLRVINDILNFSKVEAGKMEIEYIPFNIRNLVKEVVEMISLSSDEKGLSIKYSIDDNIPNRMSGDPTRLRQVLLNYGSNAVKFTEEGYVSFEVDLLESDGDKQLIKFTVSDTGIGIPEEKQSQIFSSFSQGDSSTTRKFGGTGLGLAICRQLADLMDAEVGLESEEGKGSSFYFTVPLEKVAADKRTDSDSQSEENQVESIGKSLRILVAEDNKVNQMVTTKMLEKEGFVIDIVETGTEAIEYLEQNEYDLILMDVQMPEMDGYEATKKIRTMEKRTNKHIPVIALTASAMEKDRELCLQAGMDDYIAKPVDKQDLIKTIKKVIEMDFSLLSK
ncbi:hybrid sensor histidine kinase/response regulator [Aliifodinibius salipaludis]|uniref:Sensory/regulatory protein RpfC n=1 Tax=Fodinibius salipaludis TaxID=2032627 RepID=A0A2A2GFL6_9BACT|nr:response regulator [Aliifodinibius salipaludis]PAU95562.1 hybrid sensor histidine kinase/response regulator [Aliifodinibius salipaludis]